MTTATRTINTIRWHWVLPYMPLASRPVLRNMLLIFTILLTSFATICSKHISRQLCTGLQAQQDVRNTHYENWYLGNDYEYQNGLKVISIIIFHFTNNDNKPGEVHLLILLVWQKQHGQWKLLARQAVKKA